MAQLPCRHACCAPIASLSLPYCIGCVLLWLTTLVVHFCPYPFYGVRAFCHLYAALTSYYSCVQCVCAFAPVLLQLQLYAAPHLFLLLCMLPHTCYYFSAQCWAYSPYVCSLPLQLYAAQPPHVEIPVSNVCTVPTAPTRSVCCLQRQVVREAARAIGNLSANVDFAAMFFKLGIVPLMITMLRSSDMPAARMAAMALSNVATNVKNQPRMVRKGVVEPIVTLARSGLDPKSGGDREVSVFLLLTACGLVVCVCLCV